MESKLSGRGQRRGTNNRHSKETPTVSRKDRKAREGWRTGTKKEDRKEAHQEHRTATDHQEGRRASWHKRVISYKAETAITENSHRKHAKGEARRDRHVAQQQRSNAKSRYRKKIPQI